MITGRSGGSGKYSYREASMGPVSVMVAHMPDDGFKVRIVFKSQGETSVPIMKVDEHSAILLWSALKAMAADLEWDDRMIGENVPDREMP